MDDPLKRGFDASAALDNNDDLAAVLRGHLYIEAALHDLLRYASPDDGPNLFKLGFAQKLRLARNLGLLNRDEGRLLEAINDVRNDFAHLPIRESLDDAQREKLIRAFGEEKAETVKAFAEAQMRDQWKNQDTARLILRMAFAQVFTKTLAAFEGGGAARRSSGTRP